MDKLGLPKSLAVWNSDAVMIGLILGAPNLLLTGVTLLPRPATTRVTLYPVL